MRQLPTTKIAFARRRGGWVPKHVDGNLIEGPMPGP